MVFDTSVIETIKSRRSWRTFSNRLVEEEKLEELLNATREIASPFGAAVRVEVLHKDLEQPVRLGTYGTIKGASTFIAGITDSTDTSPEDFGYVFENLILKAAEMGLGTCWLGGTFSRGDFTGKLELKTGEKLMAVTPLGYAEDRRAFSDRIAFTVAGSARRLPPEKLFFRDDFSRPMTPEGTPGIPFEMVRLGPSASNRQPWRIVSVQGRHHFYLMRNPAYGRMMKAGGLPDLQRLDIGIAMAHFELSSRELGFPGIWVRKDPKIKKSGTAQYICTWE